MRMFLTVTGITVFWAPSVSKAERLRRQALGKKVPRYTKIRTNYNRLGDGLHFTNTWRTYMGQNAVTILMNELNSFTEFYFDKLMDRRRRRSSTGDKVGFNIPQYRGSDEPRSKRRRQ